MSMNALCMWWVGRLRKRSGCICAMLVLALHCDSAWAGGGLVLRDDVCILQIGFYEAHFTAYQPQARGNQEFCKVLPDIDETLFVLDYMHSSLKEVPVDFRIIRDVTGLGEFVQVSDVEQLGDLGAHTVFYQSPRVEENASLRVEYTFVEAGDYVCIVTAGHPSKNTVYLAAFPLKVGGTNYLYAAPIVGVALITGFVFMLRRRVQQT